MAVYLIRHGLSEGNSKGIFQGASDYPLTKFGRMQAQALGRWLNHSGVAPRLILTSPLSRARQTAEELAALTGEPELVEDAGLKEFDGGRVEGKTLDEIHREFPGFATRPLMERADMSDYGGESYDAIQARVRRFIQRVEQEFGDDDVLVVTHGGTLHQLVCNWCSRPVPRHVMSRLSNCCCHKLELETVAGESIGRIQWFVTLDLIAPDVAASPVNPSRL